GDGHVTPAGYLVISQAVRGRENLDWLQMMAVTFGFKTSLRPIPGTNKYSLCVTRGRPVTLRTPSNGRSPIGREHYTGTVWCPTTGTGTFVARRSGYVFLTGNSFFPHRQEVLDAGILEAYRHLADVECGGATAVPLAVAEPE